MYSLDNRHSLALPYWARPSFASFAAKVDGGGDEPDEDEPDDDSEGSEEDDEDEDKNEDELRAELKATRDSIKKANDSSAVRRKKIRELKTRLAAQDAIGAKPATSATGEAPDIDAIEKGGAARGRAEALSMVKKSSTRAALASAGVSKEKLAKAVGLINLDELDVDDDGEIDGLEDAVNELRKDWPEIFGRTVSRRRSVSGSNDSDGDRAGKVTKLSATERQAQALVPGARITANR